VEVLSPGENRIASAAVPPTRMKAGVKYLVNVISRSLLVFDRRKSNASGFGLEGDDVGHGRGSKARQKFGSNKIDWHQ
jgi:hypothetical protein